MNLFRKAMLAVTTMLLALVAIVIPVNKVTNVEAFDITGETTLYLTPNSNWKQANARFAIYVFNESSNAWADMKAVNGETDLYSAIVPSGTWSKVIFCRMNPASTSNSWDNKWNQTSDLTYDGVNNHYTVGSGAWDKGNGSWSKYTPVTPIITHKVSFITNTDETFENLIIVDGDELSIEKLPTPKVNGYPFEGWYLDLNYDNAFTTTTIEDDLTLYAKWGEYNGIADHGRVRVYFENTNNWSTVYAYVWNGKDANSWTETDAGTPANKLEGTNYYYYDTYCSNIIFNNNNNKEQTVDIVISTTQSLCVKLGDIAETSGDGNKKYNVVSAYSNEINVKFQTKTNGENFDMRLVGTLGNGSDLDLADYQEVGFVVLDPNSDRTVIKSTTSVYTSVEANGSIVNATDLNATYVFVLTVTNVPVEEGFYVLPYAITASGSYLFGTAQTFIVL